MSFLDFGLNQAVVKSLDSAGYENPTVLQKQLIPLILQRRNIIVGSQTAAGKTGGYLIPLTSYLLDNPVEEHTGARILVLTSRRDRVNQINYTLKRIIGDHDMRIGFISGGRPYQHQMRLLKRPLDFLIATPGRLNDLVENNKSDFSSLEALVIDDFSVIHHHGQHELCKNILEQANGDCPAIAFAHRGDKADAWLKDLLEDAAEIEVEEEKHPLLAVPQAVYIADDHTHKIAIMDHMLDEIQDRSTLVYTNSNKTAEALLESLANHGHKIELAHEASRQDGKITSKEHPAIIVSDQIAVDLLSKSYENIIHFDLPKQISIFQNRISNKGWEELERPAALLVGPHDRMTLKKIESQSGESLQQQILPGLEPLNPYSSTPLLTLNKNKSRNKKKAGDNKDRFRKRKGSNLLGNANRKNHTKQKQHKGPYGRLNGGIHRKRNSDSKRGEQANGHQTGYQNQHSGNKHQQPGKNANNLYQNPAKPDYTELGMQELKERKQPARKVVIRYKDRKKRSQEKSESSESSSD